MATLAIREIVQRGDVMYVGLQGQEVDFFPEQSNFGMMVKVLEVALALRMEHIIAEAVMGDMSNVGTCVVYDCGGPTHDLPDGYRYLPEPGAE